MFELILMLVGDAAETTEPVGQEATISKALRDERAWGDEEYYLFSIPNGLKNLWGYVAKHIVYHAEKHEHQGTGNQAGKKRSCQYFRMLTLGRCSSKMGGI